MQLLSYIELYSCHRSARSVTFSRLSDTPYWQAMPVKAPQPAAIHLSAGGNMQQFTPTQIDALSALVSADRFSTGQSNRELHIKDISPTGANCRPASSGQ
jgi:hypothetical protein